MGHVLAPPTTMGRTVAHSVAVLRRATGMVLARAMAAVLVSEIM